MARRFLRSEGDASRERRSSMSAPESMASKACSRVALRGDSFPFELVRHNEPEGWAPGLIESRGLAPSLDQELEDTFTTDRQPREDPDRVLEILRVVILV
jgi:hypothetical protein